MNNKMKLGISLRYLGYHIAAWRHPDVPPAGALSFKHYLDITKQAEAEKLDMIFFADGLGVREADVPKGALAGSMKNAELEPLTLLAALGSHTHNIGLVATASTTYNSPFHVARRFASIDHISGGRAGWNVVTSWTTQEAQNFNLSEQMEYTERYERAEEFVDVVKKLWRSWEDDAFIRDKESGIFYDQSKLHPANHKGKHFQVQGPLNSARTPQGEPVVFQAGVSEPGVNLGSRVADVIYNMPIELEQAQSFYADIKKRAGRFGRESSPPLIMPGFTPYVGATRQEAQDKFDQLQDLLDPKVAMSAVYSVLGDLSGHDIDGPVPELDINIGLKGIAKYNYESARKRGYSIRKLLKSMVAANSGRYIIGSAEDIVDSMQEWFENGAADGFNICPAILPGGMDDLSRYILPELRRRDLFRTEYESSTLRGNLGL